ncbi:hypothetical protein [Agrococcus baldri]|uniref:hypothetical protein n=1 Tax=Agrococcus baldri TaxID=153730 RepID=UPI000B8170AE|nr:hypothetical protein [Agrococcus baldri]
MLARLTSGIALASIAALALVGCTPPEPTDEQILVEARETYDGFYRAIDDQMTAGRATGEDLEPYATSELATEWAGYVQTAIDAGTTSHGVPTIVDIELVEQSNEQVSTELCVDGRGIETTNEDGSTTAPSELVAWSATFTRQADGPSLQIAGLAPIQDQTVCE